MVVASTIAGLVVGAAVDPLGQRLADASRTADLRRRAERLAEGTPDGTEPAPASPGAHLVPTGTSLARTSGAAISTGCLFGAAAVRFGPHLIAAPYDVFFAVAVVVSVTDLSHRLVPRTLLYGALAVIVPLLVAVSGTTGTWNDLWAGALASAVAFAVFFAIWWAMPRGMGFGDVRLAGVVGLVTGYLSLLHAYLAFLVAFVAGALVGVVLMAASGAGRRTRIPFAPTLAAGAVVAVLWGGPLAHDLFHTGG